MLEKMDLYLSIPSRRARVCYRYRYYSSCESFLPMGEQAVFCSSLGNVAMPLQV